MSSTRESSKASPEKKNVDDPRRRELEPGEQKSLYNAIVGGRTLDVYKMLLSNHIHPDADLGRANPLSEACFNGKSDIVEFFIMNGACLEGDGGGDSPLFSTFSRSKAKEECAELLLRHKADVNARNRYNFTFLMLAASGSSQAILRLLLEHQADVNAERYDKTVVDFARKSIHADPKAVDLLEAAAKRSSRK